MVDKLHHFDSPADATGDLLLAMCKEQGYVPKGCLLGGGVVLALTRQEDPCARCNCTRSKCNGRPRQKEIR